MDERILQIETHAMHAWPAEETEDLDGWVLRRHTSPSRRVNSVWPNAWRGERPLALKLEKVEMYYAALGQPARYQVCPAARPAGLDDVLEARGYKIDAPTGVQVASAGEVRQASAPRETGARLGIDETLSAGWVAAYCSVNGAPESEAAERASALGRVKLPVVYVQADMDGRPAAVGRGVLGDGWLGIFGMATHESYRRRGLATAVIHAISTWALDHGTERLYLQVMDVSGPALALYAGLGFNTLYHYHYRHREQLSSVVRD